MNIDKNLIDISQITFLCTSIGKEKDILLKEFITKLNEKFSKIQFSNFYQTELKEKTKMSFPLKAFIFFL